MALLASYHTLLAYSDDLDNEWSSYGNMADDILATIDGYIATPGGRLWYKKQLQKSQR